MEDILIPLLVAIIIGIIGPIITLRIKHKFNQRKYPIQTIDRLQRLTGTWKGNFTQEDPSKLGEVLSTSIEINLRNNGRIIEGSAQYISVLEGENFTVQLRNGIFDGNILKIDYDNEKLYIFHKGAIVLKMDDRANQLIGKYIGYSPNLHKIIDGKIKLDRHNN